MENQTEEELNQDYYFQNLSNDLIKRRKNLTTDQIDFIDRSKDFAEIIQKVNATWKRYVKEGKIVPTDYSFKNFVETY
jgi:hypothetical protein